MTKYKWIELTEDDVVQFEKIIKETELNAKHTFKDDEDGPDGRFDDMSREDVIKRAEQSAKDLLRYEN